MQLRWSFRAASPSVLSTRPSHAISAGLQRASPDLPLVSVEQVQVVAYLHAWEPSSRRHGKGGAFVHWASPDEGSTAAAAAPTTFAAWPLAGSAIDGSKVVHAADVYLGRHPRVAQEPPEACA